MEGCPELSSAVRCSMPAMHGSCSFLTDPGWLLALSLPISAGTQLCWVPSVPAPLRSLRSCRHLELSQQLLTHGRMRPLERDVVKLFFLSAARIRSLGPFHPSESSSAAAWLLFQVHSGCSVSKSPFFHTEYCRVSGGLSLPCEGEHHLARLPSRSLDCLQHTGLLLELGGEFGGAMFGHFQQVWGWKLGRMGGFAPTMGWKITMSTEGIHFDNLELREKRKCRFQDVPWSCFCALWRGSEGPSLCAPELGCGAGGSLSWIIWTGLKAFFPLCQRLQLF